MGTSSSSASRIQLAIYEYLTNPYTSIRAAAVKYELHLTTFFRILRRWQSDNHRMLPASAADFVVPECRAGRPRAFTAAEEDLIANTALEYANDNWPLTTTLVE